MKKIRIGIIGLGGIANKHIDELLQQEGAKITAICDISPAAIAEKNKRLGLAPEKCYEDYRALIADAEVDAVEICTPNHLHAPMAIAALQAGKPVNLEKPIAMTSEEAARICAAQKESGALGMTCFSYRFKPAVRYAKHLVESGSLGKIVGLNVAYLKDSALWEGRKLEWRFVKEYACSGVIGDLGVHLIDLAQLLAGEMDGVFAMQKTVVTERPLLDGSGTGKVETEDMCGFIASFACGAQGTFHITRAAAGYKNTIRYDVYGTKGAISFDLDHPEHLSVCCGEGDLKKQSFETVEVPREFYLDQEEAFIHAMQGRTDPLFPSLSDGAQGQRVIDALLRSAEEKRWVSL